MHPNISKMFWVIVILFLFAIFGKAICIEKPLHYFEIFEGSTRHEKGYYKKFLPDVNSNSNGNITRR